MSDATIEVGDVVRVGKGATLWQVIEKDGAELVCLSKRRMQKRHHHDRLTLVCRQGDPSMTWHEYVCEACMESRWLGIDDGRQWRHCDICDDRRLFDSTMAEKPREGEWREDRNAEHNAELGKQLRLLDDSLAMCEELGVRVIFKELTKYDCRAWAERGRGKTTWFIYLDSRLPVEDQLGDLGNVWRYLLPANETRWSEDEWVVDDEDPEMEHFGLSWPHKRALVDDAAIRRAAERKR